MPEASRRRGSPASRPAVEPPVRAIEWRGGAEDGALVLLDQTRLPARVRYLKIRDVAGVVDAIRRLAVRGAPAIGVAAAYGMVLGAQKSRAATRAGFLRDLERVRARLAASRPTAVNLFHALDRMVEAARRLELPERGWGAAERRKALERLLEEAKAIHREDEELCRKIGEHGASLIRSGSGVLTHCNAGALATGGLGTALAVLYCAARKGKKLRVFADETRPLLQGARLTSWELSKAGIDVTVICDNAAGALMRRGDVQCVVVGADRIARNGDFANKIGTYQLAVLAREHGIPFYVAAPSTTFDLECPSGDAIPIEERSPDEVVSGLGGRIAPRGVRAYNPAFDVTPAKYVTAFITERGVIHPPFARNIPRVLSDRRGETSGARVRGRARKRSGTSRP